MQDNLPPVFLLDVDGVINVDRPAWPDADARATVTTSDGVTWPFRWSPALVIELGRLHAGGLVEIRWCTT